MSAQEETRKNLRSPGQPFLLLLCFCFFCCLVSALFFPVLVLGAAEGAFVCLGLSLYFFSLCFLAPVSGRWGTLGQEHVCVSEYRWRTWAGRLEEESQATEPSSRALERPSKKLRAFCMFFFPACCFGLSK